VDAATPFLAAARPVVADLRPFSDEVITALPELHAAAQRVDPVTNALLPYLPDLAAFTIQTRSIVSLDDGTGGILRATAPISFQTPPPVLGGINNSIRPHPATRRLTGWTGRARRGAASDDAGCRCLPGHGSGEVLAEPADRRTAGLFEVGNVDVEVSAWDEFEALGLQCLLVGHEREIGDSHRVPVADDHHERRG